ncbi:MAG: hypothetical protein KBF47_18575, partial [Gemmatimonadales bacterium]|nr:hypothetical protein [Gemmatimonadales bacterium]
VYALTALERARWVLAWRTFEVFVGKHWTYPRASGGWKPSAARRAMARIYYRWIAGRITP